MPGAIFLLFNNTSLNITLIAFITLYQIRVEIQVLKVSEKVEFSPNIVEI